MADETLIQSQQVTLTGPVERVSLLLRVLDLDQNYWGVTVTLTPTSVTDAAVGVTRDSQQNPQQQEEIEQYRALMELACADIIFFHSQDSAFTVSDPYEHPLKVAFSVMVNDLFVPAADAEGFDISEAIPLRDIFRKDGFEGVVRWVQQKRDGMPLRPHVEKRLTDAQGSVTGQSQQKSQQDGE